MALLQRLWMSISKPKEEPPPLGVRLTCFAHLDDEFPPDYRYPPMWRKEWDRKHAERIAGISVVGHACAGSLDRNDNGCAKFC